MKKDKSVKVALDSRKMFDNCKKNETGHAKCGKTTESNIHRNNKSTDRPLCVSQVDLKYALSELKPSGEKSILCKFATTGGNKNGCYRFRKGFYGLSDIPTLFH